MAGPERINMAGEGGAPTEAPEILIDNARGQIVGEHVVPLSQPQGPEQTAEPPAVIVEPEEVPNVVVAAPEVRRGGLLRRFLGRGPQPTPAQPVTQAAASEGDVVDVERRDTTTPDDNTGIALVVTSGSGGGNTGGEGGGLEGPRGPEGARDPEWETSPERGRWLCDEIVRFRTTMTYQERYNEINGPIYAQRLQELQEYVDAWCEIRNDPDPWDPSKAYPKPQPWEPGNPLIQPPEFPPLPQAMQELNQMVNQFRDQYRLEGIEEVNRPERFPDEPLPDPNDENRSINARRGQYNNPSSRQELTDAQADLQVYFRQAKNHGLLREVDAVLNSIYQEVTTSMGRIGISTSQIEAILNQRIDRVRQFARVEFNEKSIADSNIPDELSTVGDAYIDWAERRIQRVLNGQPQIEHREGEWSIPTPEQADEGRRNTYWEIGNYPKYYHISARNEDQFRRAKETFFQMIRSGSIGRSPTAIFEHVKNFIDVFGSEGGRQVREGNINLNFLTENRLELEALLYVYVGNYSNEVYNPKQKKEAMTAMALDEGPARWVALYLAGGGQIATFTHMFDKEALMDIYTNPVGERGELDIVAGHFLQDQIQEMVIERGMGIMLKDYDPRDENLNSDNLRAKIEAAADLERIKLKLSKSQVLDEREQARYNAYRDNLRRLGLTKSDEEFKGLYEGFNKGDTHIKNYQRFSEDQSRPKNQRQFPDLTKLPESLRKSINLGRIQAELWRFRHAILNGQIKLERGKRAIDLLSLQDRQVYQAAYDDASANFDIAFQMQGVLGEKARRGRGFLYIDRNPHIRYYFELGDRLRLQKKDIDLLNQDKLNQLRDSIPESERRSFDIGWMLSQLRGGKKLDSFPQKWQDFYRDLRPEDKHNFVDNIPTYQAENFVQWAVFWTKMKYADKSAPFRKQKADEARTRHIEELRTKGYVAQLWDDELGPDGQPKPMTFKRPLGMIDPNSGQFRKFKNGEVLGYNQTGQEVKLAFDNNGNPIGLDFDQEGKLIVYNQADPNNRHRVYYEGITRNTKAKLVNDTLVEEAVATFQTAAHSSDFRNRSTTHTYWFYQGNNRVTILTDRIHKAAERIRDGISRPEDEDILATQLLIVDPTLRRVKKFEDVNQQREVTLVAAAVEESYQGKQTTKRELHKAFLPKDGNRGRMRAGYRNEDWAGMDRFTLGFEEFVAQQPARFARRLGAEIALAPFEHNAAAPSWGMHGVSGAIEVMADEIKKFSHQGIVGQFGITKFIDEMDNAVDIFSALVGDTNPQTKEHVFGLYEKPTDNNEKLHKFYSTIRGILGVPDKNIPADPSTQVPFLYDFLETFGRLTKVIKLMRSTYTNIRNSAGPLDLEGVEVFLPDGSFNTAIETDKKIAGNTGTARHSQTKFFNSFVEWLLSEESGGGGDVYPEELFWNKFLKAKRVVATGSDKDGQIIVKDSDDTFGAWVLSKIM